MSMTARVRSILNSNTVRKIALPLRTANPRLYKTLNGLRQRILTGSSGMAAYQANAIARFEAVADLAGKRVLEIGTDLEMGVLRQLHQRGMSEGVGVNNDAEFWQQHDSPIVAKQGQLRLVDGDVRHLSFADNSFDYVFSVATLEHILQLPVALAEMYRVLKPDGIMFASFGPIWSSGKGHHLRVEVDGEEARHFLPESNPLPDFSHLLMTPDELRSCLQGHASPKLIEPIVQWTYFDSGINRLFHHQYVEMFESSRFQLLSLTPERDPVDTQLQKILQFRFPEERDFDVTNTSVVLLKPR